MKISLEELKSKFKPKIKPIIWNSEKKVLTILDQSLLPFETKYIDLVSPDDVYLAIKEMKVRGAPAIGITAAYGIVLSIAHRKDVENINQAFKIIVESANKIAKARPTAVNLEWSVKRMLKKAEECIESNICKNVKDLLEVLENEANKIFNEELEAELKMSIYGLEKINDDDGILTICNAGGLATGTGLGTALGPIKIAHLLGLKIKVYVPETRPWLQGARLTVYELINEGIETILITDTAVGYVMYKGFVNSVFVGADRILSDGHVINKVGTFKEAVIAHELGIPFYVVAPISTFDLNRKVNEVEIEVRDPDEVRKIKDIPITIENVKVFNPVFDITPPKYITAIITEKGIIYPPFDKNIPRVIKGG